MCIFHTKIVLKRHENSHFSDENEGYTPFKSYLQSIFDSYPKTFTEGHNMSNIFITLDHTNYKIKSLKKMFFKYYDITSYIRYSNAELELNRYSLLRLFVHI